MHQNVGLGSGVAEKAVALFVFKSKQWLADKIHGDKQMRFHLSYVSCSAIFLILFQILVRIAGLGQKINI